MIDSQHRVPPSLFIPAFGPAFVLTFALTLALFAVPARAAANPWTPVGPGGGVIESLAVDPDLLYASYRTAIWRSADGGESWTRISGEAPSRLAVLGPHTLLASHCGVLRSTDDGRTWKQVIPCGSANDGFRTPVSLSADPRDPRTVYVHFSILEGTHNYFFEAYRSHDGGATFQPITASFEVGKRAASQVWTDLTHPGIIYVGAYDGGLFAGKFE